MAVGTATGTTGAGFLQQTIPTEFAVNAFGLVSGAFGALAGLVAANRLAQRERTIPIRDLVIPVVVAGSSTVLGALLLPAGD